ncbi:hypothetical protein Y032_0127g1388 [Ancylostoma ceylanicum]|uniref:Uncharacterized protein n=1 Tax=Ancylostoma ceylanicum TaxID=53326 RepID=A0A016T885_9BILA|nr:hypothetical protein Y032_0127g1388 [Ancylostoma ceylanicum]
MLHPSPSKGILWRSPIAENKCGRSCGQSRARPGPSTGVPGGKLGFVKGPKSKGASYRSPGRSPGKNIDE